MRVYLAGPVRGIEAPPGALQAIREALDGMGHEIVNTLPAHGQKRTIAQADTRAFIQETDRMLGADLLVADVSTPSHGVGWTVAWFLAKGRLAVLCCQRDALSGLGVMLAGNPSPWQRLVTYTDADDLKTQLANALKM